MCYRRLGSTSTRRTTSSSSQIAMVVTVAAALAWQRRMRRSRRPLASGHVRGVSGLRQLAASDRCSRFVELAEAPRCRRRSCALLQ
ncbi:hypothetical protein SORBI_3005G147600 [Sorghum bicolor]|nr:hypothetical protein SORBI_3005G147600 [Sorghum bicolor]